MDDRKLLALLNGIVRHDFYGDMAITDEMLHENLSPEQLLDDFKHLLDKYRNLLRVILIRVLLCWDS